MTFSKPISLCYEESEFKCARVCVCVHTCLPVCQSVCRSLPLPLSFLLSLFPSPSFSHFLSLVRTHVYVCYEVISS